MHTLPTLHILSLPQLQLLDWGVRNSHNVNRKHSLMAIEVINLTCENSTAYRMTSLPKYLRGSKVGHAQGFSAPLSVSIEIVVISVLI